MEIVGYQNLYYLVTKEINNNAILKKRAKTRYYFSEKVKISTSKNCSRKRPGWEKAPGRLSIHT